MKEYRCGKCKKLLFKVTTTDSHIKIDPDVVFFKNDVDSVFEIKCQKCKKINKISFFELR